MRLKILPIDGTKVVRAKLLDGVIREVEMARLKGFRASGWSRSLGEWLAKGLVHRRFCAYHRHHFGDHPKGIVYSPFYCTSNWDFSGKTQPDAM